MNKRIFLSTLAILFFTLSLTGIFTYFNTKSLYYDFVEDGLSRSLEAIEDTITGRDSFFNANENVMIKNTVLNSGYRVTLIESDGSVAFDTDRQAENMDNHSLRPEIIEALSDMGSIKRSIRYSNSVGADMMYIAKGIQLDESDEVVVRVSMKLSLTENILYQSLRDTILYILLSFLVAALFSKYLISYFLTPIKVITSFAHKISKGNYLERMTWFRKDEIGNLTDSLNEMANELQSSFNQLSDRNAELESILINIVNGIIAIDKKYRIKIINKSAYEMLGIPEERNLLEKNLLEALRVTAIYEKVEEVIKSKDLENVKFMETTIGEKIFRVTISKIKDYDVVHGYIIVLQDITQIRKLESIRKDFVANVSHELKTPITSIKGFIETLKEGGIEDEETRNHFYDIINMETERLIELVEDILTLSFLDNESKTRTISKEFIDVKLEIQKAAYMLERACREKRIELKLNIQENLPKICFNKDYFRQMNINLLSNAIKYSDDGGEIEIKALLEENKIRLSILDTGIGIPSADIDRIFERFYRVDKGRARKEGGTGLGLAIVKHIAQSQGAEITVESTVEKGTTFTIYIDTKC